MFACHKGGADTKEDYLKLENDDQDELIYVFPKRSRRRRISSWNTKRRFNELPNTSCNQEPVPSLTSWDRLVHSRDIWCLPEVRRREAEDILRETEVGNFILRVNRHDNAMVLSRCVKPEAFSNCVQHNVIQVIPRSGYSLTSDTETRLVFNSLIRLLHFYLRLPPKPGGPFLRLPKMVRDATSLEQVDTLNREGKNFWNRAMRSTVHTKIPKPVFEIPRARTHSVDRWSDRDAEHIIAGTRAVSLVRHQSLKVSSPVVKAKHSNGDIWSCGGRIDRTKPSVNTFAKVSGDVINTGSKRLRRNLTHLDQVPSHRHPSESPVHFEVGVNSFDKQKLTTDSSLTPYTVDQSHGYPPQGRKRSLSARFTNQAMTNPRSTLKRSLSPQLGFKTLGEHLQMLEIEANSPKQQNVTTEVASSGEKTDDDVTWSHPEPVPSAFEDSGHGSMSVGSDSGKVNRRSPNTEPSCTEYSSPRPIGQPVIMETVGPCGREEYELLSESSSGLTSSRRRRYRMHRQSSVYEVSLENPLVLVPQLNADNKDARPVEMIAKPPRKPRKVSTMDYSELTAQQGHIYDPRSCVSVASEHASNNDSHCDVDGRHDYKPTTNSVKLTPKSLRTRRFSNRPSPINMDLHHTEVTSHPSPDTSSRTSTVFCPPWEEAPTGAYLSDLISLSAESNNKRTSLCRHQSLNFPNRDPMPSSDKTPTNETPLQRIVSGWMHEDLPSQQKSENMYTFLSRMPAPPPHCESFNQMDGKNRPSELSTTPVTVTPYAVTKCSWKSPEMLPRRELFSDSTWKTNPARPSESPGVYDEAFVEEQTHSDSAQFESDQHRRLLESSKSEEILLGRNQGWKNDDENKDYVYAQVVPRILRKGTRDTLPVTLSMDKSMNATHLLMYPDKPPIITLESPTNDRRLKRLIVSPTPSTVGNATTSTSKLLAVAAAAAPIHASSANTSRSSSPHIQWPEPPSGRLAYERRSLELNERSVVGGAAQMGYYVRKFIKKLMKDKNSEMYKNVQVFIECTKNKSDQGAYRTMQLTRQFITGLTRRLLHIQDSGLTEAVEKDKQQLGELGFLNVSVLIENTIQHYVLRPLYRHIMRNLRQDQLNHNDLGPLRNIVQLACFHASHQKISDNLRCLTEFGFPSHLPLPSDNAVHVVDKLFRELEVSYSIPDKLHGLGIIIQTIRREILGPEGYNTDAVAAPEDMHAVYAWTLSRAGVLIAPVITSQPTPGVVPSLNYYSPAALQADYLDALATDSQLSQQTGDVCAVAELFGALYWAWSHSNTKKAGNEVFLSSPQIGTPKSANQNAANGNCFTFGNTTTPRSMLTIARQPAECVHKLQSQGHPSVVGKKKIKKRRFPSSMRSKTSDGSQESCSRECSFGSLRRNNLSNPDLRVSGSDPESKSASKMRWRPWAGQGVGPQQVPTIKVAVMDERTSQMRVQMFPVKKNMTAGELGSTLAQKMRLTDPTQFAIFLLAENKEYQLPETYNLSELNTRQTCEPVCEDRKPSQNTLTIHMETRSSSDVRTESRRRAMEHSKGSKSRQLLNTTLKLFNRKKSAVSRERESELSQFDIPEFTGLPILIYRRIGSILALSEHALSLALNAKCTINDRSL